MEGGTGVETERRAQAFRREFIDIRHEIIGSALKLRELYVQELEEFIRGESSTSVQRPINLIQDQRRLLFHIFNFLARVSFG